MGTAYFSSEVAKSLNIGASTLRKYAYELEEQGYHFDRGVNNSRVFYQKDILVIQRIMAAIEKQNMALDKAIKLAVSMDVEDSQAMPATVEEQPESAFEKLYQRIESLEKNQEHLIQINLNLVQQFEEQQCYIKNKLEERDQTLIASLRSIQEEKVKPQPSIRALFSFFSKKKREA